MTEKRDFHAAAARLAAEVVQTARGVEDPHRGRSSSDFYDSVISELDALTDRIWQLARPS